MLFRLSQSQRARAAEVPMGPGWIALAAGALGLTEEAAGLVANTHREFLDYCPPAGALLLEACAASADSVGAYGRLWSMRNEQIEWAASDLRERGVLP